MTIHMAASLDGFIARKDGSVDWMETSDEFPDGDTMDPEFVEAFLVGRVRNSFQLFAGDGGELKALRRGVFAIRRGDATPRSSVSAPDN